MSVVIDRVLAEHTVEDWAGEPAADRAERLGFYLVELRHRYANLTPAESTARLHLNGLIVEAENELARVNLASRYPFPLLSLEPLRWTQERKVSGMWGVSVPKLALLPLQKEELRISASWWTARDSMGRWRRMIIDPHERRLYQTDYPKPIMDIYRPLADKLADCQPRRTHYTLVWSFKHVIPDRVKETITTIAPTRDFEAMFLLADTKPEEWTVLEAKKQDEPRQPRFDFDPLIVGWAHEALWLIDRFDATPLEEYVASEFALPVERQLEA